MKILIIGASGFLGKELFKDFSSGNEVLGTYNEEEIKGLVHLDLLQKEEIREQLLRFKPQVLLLPAAIAGVDFCQQNQDLAWNVNVEGTKEIAVISKKLEAFLIFYSTDYIFDGKNGPYSEEDRPNPINFYGKTKLEAERIIKKDLKRFLIIRTCNIYGYEKEGKNFAMQVLDFLGQKKIMNVPNDQFGTPTYVEDLSEITSKLVDNKKGGIYNVVGCDYLNRIQFAKEIAEIFNLNQSLIKGISSEGLKQAAERPKKGGLKIGKLMAEIGIKSMSVNEGLLAMKGKIDRDKEG